MDAAADGCHTVALCAARKHLKGGQELASQWLQCGNMAIRLVLLASNPETPSLTVGAFIEVRCVDGTSGNGIATVQESPRAVGEWSFDRIPFGIAAQAASSATRHIVKVDVQRFSNVDVDRGWWHLCSFDEVELTGQEEGAAAFVGGIICPRCYEQGEGARKDVGGISGAEMRTLTTALQRRASLLATQYQALQLGPSPADQVVIEQTKSSGNGCAPGCSSGCLWGSMQQSDDKEISTQ
mmetsp:Transcript_53691/g.142763  ORF Transcript_53691/g.142763 Transcript_53691/m.142763 type:complete len:239 (+) Transcript_53691:51-767(+)